MFVFGDGNSTEVFFPFSELFSPYFLLFFEISLIKLTARIFLLTKKLRYAPAVFISEISLEELVEAIVNERWVKFEEKLSIFDKRDLNLQQQIQDMKKQIDELGQQREKEEKMFMEKFWKKVLKAILNMQSRLM